MLSKLFKANLALKFCLLLSFSLVAFVVFGGSAALAEPDPYPPCEPGAYCVVPQGWVYPATGQPIANLCNQRKVLIPNASKFYDSGGPIYDGTTTDSSIWMEVWYSVYVCDGHPEIPETTSYVTYSVFWVASGTIGDAKDGNVGGNGGAWVGAGFGVNLNMGDNNLCHTIAGNVSESPGYFENLGYCVNIRRDAVVQAPGGNVDGYNCTNVWGWAFDWDDPARSIAVHIYIDGSAATGAGYNTGLTTVPRPDVNSHFGISGIHGFDWPVPAQYRDGNTHSVYVYAINIGPPATNTQIGTGTIPACVDPVNCSPSSQTAGTGSLMNFSATGGTGNYTWSGGGTPTTGSGVNFSTTFPNPGNYVVRATSVSASGTCNVRIVARPYLKVFGADVQAGSGFGENCTATNATAGIITFNRGSPGYEGSGTKMAAFALGTIDGFSSAGSNSPPKNLTFSNTTGATYGGGSELLHCISDYWAGAPDTIPAPNLTSPVAEGEDRVVYANGDVTISGNIVYANSGGWTDLSKIPSFYLIVKGGNIKIDKSVTQLDGVYVAIPDGATGGTIYTCTNGSTLYSGTVPTATGTGGCGNKLSINGAFIANQVKFLRTPGNVSGATNSELPASTNLAEVFIYGPELWTR